MAQSITDFKAGFNGGTRANRFRVQINWPSVVGTGQQSTPPTLTLDYHVIAAKLPSAELGTIKVPYRGRIAYYAGDREYKPWTVTILDDTSTGTNSWKHFHSWADALGSHDDNTVNDPTFSQSVSGTSEYLKDLDFIQLHGPITTGLGFEDHKKITLHHAWPSEIGEISLDMGEGGGLVSFSVTFMYDYYTIEKDGDPTSPSTFTSGKKQYPRIIPDVYNQLG